jgi:hypothetical protein
VAPQGGAAHGHADARHRAQGSHHANTREATRIAKLAEAHIEAGNFQRGVAVALEIEPLICSVNTFLNAASMITTLGQAMRDCQSSVTASSLEKRACDGKAQA